MAYLHGRPPPASDGDGQDGGKGGIDQRLRDETLRRRKDG